MMSHIWIWHHRTNLFRLHVTFTQRKWLLRQLSSRIHSSENCKILKTRVFSVLVAKNIWSAESNPHLLKGFFGSDYYPSELAPKSELVWILDRAKLFGCKIVGISKTTDYRTISFVYWTFQRSTEQAWMTEIQTFSAKLDHLIYK